MKYRDLVNFEPIDSVIQLTDANNKDRALNLLIPLLYLTEWLIQLIILSLISCNFPNPQIIKD